jgi:hypothetical protein
MLCFEPVQAPVIFESGSGAAFSRPPGERRANSRPKVSIREPIAVFLRSVSDKVLPVGRTIFAVVMTCLRRLLFV